MIGLLSPLRVIAQYCGVTPRTVRKWRQYYRFPLLHLPSGRAVTSPALIDRWLEEEENRRPPRNRRGEQPRAAVWKMRIPQRQEESR